MTFQAKFPGTCGECGGRFPEGAEVKYDLTDIIIHAVCPDADRLDLTARPVCPKCFIEVSNIGTCGCDE